MTWDYRCPFARNAHEHLVAALAGGADWDVTFVPFSLDQVHVDEGQPDVWDDPEKAPALLAMQAGIAVRDVVARRVPRACTAPSSPPATTRLATSREPRGRCARCLRRADVDADAVFAEIATGTPLETFRKEHEAAVADHHVWGVPTFIAGDRPCSCASCTGRKATPPCATRTVERVVDLSPAGPTSTSSSTRPSSADPALARLGR